MLASAAATPPILAALSQAAQHRQEVGRAVRGLQGTSTNRGKLPLARTVDLEARVHRKVLPIPYIIRDEEETIRTYLRNRLPVLLIGPAMVGKTKIAARVIAEEFGSWPVAIPDNKNALASLDAMDARLEGSVIWLDDIDRLIAADGITDGALRRLVDAGNIIVGTIRARAYDQFRPWDQLRLPEWDVLSVFEHVFISRDLTQEEQKRLANAVPDPEIRDRIQTVGLGEYVGAARQVAHALKLGATGTDPLGYALVLAAADWRRCGMTRPIPSSMLALLAKPHLDHRGIARLANHDAFSAGLAWATREINPSVALLQPGGSDAYIIYDYALDLISAQGAPIPDSSWAVIMANADIPELVNLGYIAEVIYHQSGIATQAWRKAARSGHADAAPEAANDLGGLLADQGDVQGAKDAFHQAIDSGHADATPRASYNLGLLLRRIGDVQAAMAAYRQAAASRHADAAPMAARNLGLLLQRQGDIQAAKDAFHQAIDSGHADEAPKAIANLAVLLADQGDVQEAKDAFHQAIDSGHADEAPKAAYNLGQLLERQGDVQAAMAAYRQAAASRHADAAPMAARNLGLLLQRQGRAKRELPPLQLPQKAARFLR